MKLIQLNMWEGLLEHPLLRFLENEQPDILCVQELKHSDAIPFILEDIKDRTGLAYHYASPLLGYDHAGYHFNWSNGIISRYPFVDTQTHWVHKQYNPHWNMGEDFNFRNFQHAVVETDGQAYNLVNYHGYHVSGTKMGNDITMGIMNDIGDYIDGLSGPVILTGDFNLTPDSPSLARFNRNMRNLCVETNVQTTRNAMAKRADELIDYIYVSNDIHVKSFTVSDAIVSDHQPLILEL